MIFDLEPVALVVDPKNYGETRERFANDSSRITLFQLPIDDSWIRDNSPIFVVGKTGEQAVVSWRFNGWGQRYLPFANDSQVPFRIAQMLGLPCYCGPIVLEGGAVSVDGDGTALATRGSVLNANRNIGVSETDVERLFAEYLGVTKVICLGAGLKSDETDGHVDNVAVFVAPGLVVALTTSERKDENYDILKENWERLRHSRETDRRKVEVVTIEQPDPVYDGGNRLALS